MVYAELKAPAAAGAAPRKTVLFYMHFDGQSVTPSQWAQRSPWEAVLKARRADGKWRRCRWSTSTASGSIPSGGCSRARPRTTRAPS